MADAWFSSIELVNIDGKGSGLTCIESLGKNKKEITEEFLNRN
jgi:hypothetical protein